MCNKIRNQATDNLIANTLISKTLEKNTSYIVDTVLIIGLGMIGGSLAKSLKENRFAKVVAAYDQSVTSIELGEKLQVIDRGFSDLGQAVVCADLIILAVPVKATAAVLKAIKPHLKPKALISDVGSTKGSVIRAAQTVFGEVPSFFIPAHPIAGSEKSGVQAANSQLFLKHKVIITPHLNADEAAVLSIARMWQSTGAEVLQMAVEKHDEVLAATSHLPHLLAFSLVDTLAKESASLDIFRYAAGGFRDFTRIAASDPTMWSDVCHANKEAILQQIDMFSAGLAQLRSAIAQQDEVLIKDTFTRARSAREYFGQMLNGTAYAKNHEDSSQFTFYVEPSSNLVGEVTIPGDKSISHRAVFLSALSDGVCEITGFLRSEDCMATVDAFRKMGVVIEGPHQGRLKVYGVGKHGLHAPSHALYLGGSGTSMRLLTGLLAAQSFDSVLIADNALSNRPMERVATPLRAMGAKVQVSAMGTAPIYIKGGQSLKGIEYTLPMASSQVKSSLLLAALYADRSSVIKQPQLTRNHTELLMQRAGVNLTVQDNAVLIAPEASLQAFDLDVPGDFSSAAFFIVAAAISPDSHLILKNIGVNATRIGLLKILRLMGANINLLNIRENNGEEVADIVVQYRPLSGVNLTSEHVSIAIDEFPVIFVAASCAQGRTNLEGLQELRYKESDRISVMVDGLKSLGINISQSDDSVSIEGGQITGGCVDSQGDHRAAMAFAIAAFRSEKAIKITNCANVASSFPEFVEQAAKAGLRIRKEETNVSA